MVTQAHRVTRRYTSNPARLFALVFGLLFIGSFVSVFYRIVDIVGGVSWLITVVTVAFLLATACARLLSVRIAAVLGSVLLVVGVGLYVWLAPFGYRRVFTIDFLIDLVTYLTGISVLQFKRVDVWTIAVAPGPVFLTWYLFMRRQYDRGVLIGGLTLGFFVLTGDATWSTTLVGSMSALSVLSVGELEKADWSWERLKHLGGVLVAATIASQALRTVNRGAATPRSRSRIDSSEPSIESSLVETDGRVHVFNRITLSPTVRFTVTADAPAHWHVASYDRYTGSGWIRSGQTTPYTDPLAPPPGETTTVAQTFRAETSVETMPAAWKPIRVVGEKAKDTTVTSAGGFDLDQPLDEGDEYTVVSRIPEVNPERLRSTGTTYPEHVRERYLQLPESLPPRVRRKAQEITEDAATLYDAASTIEEWLKANKAYSLAVDRPDTDITDAFVFQMDGGYCVYFATAMTVLLRTLAIPARFAHGYLPGEQIADDKWVIRGFDSHAWTEVYFPNVGWVPFDPTPADPRRSAEQDRLAEARVNGITRVDTNETRSLIDTATPTGNLSTQNGNESSAATMNDTNQTPTFVTPTASDSSTLGVTRFRSSNHSNQTVRPSTAVSHMDRLTVLATIAGLLFGIHRFHLLKRGYRTVWLRWQRRTGSPYLDVGRAFERLEYLLERRYRPRDPDETPRQYLEALEPEVDPRAYEVLRLYERAYYAETISRGEADKAIQLVDELVDETG